MNRSSMFVRCGALVLALGLSGCDDPLAAPAPDAIKPRIVTQPTRHDTDDPAIWINPADPAKSLVLGTDKDSDGALYAFDLEGRVAHVIPGLARPNNVDVGYGFAVAGRTADIAVLTEREKQRLRIYRLPELAPLDAGDLVVYGGDTTRAPMGVALYRRPADGAFFVFVAGKMGPGDGYLAQYRLTADAAGKLALEPVREFGRFSGKGGIEAIAVDAELGYVYYSDEAYGVRKYAADPDAVNASAELAAFGTEGFREDREGISIYKRADGTGYLLVSDQQANRFRIYRREGEPGRPHEHGLLKSVPVTAIESDGSDVTSAALGPKFPHGLFVAMSNGRVFHYYAWEDIAGEDLEQRVPAAK